MLAHLSQRELAQELFALVSFTEDEVRGDIDLRAGILGCNESFVSPEIGRVGVKSLIQNYNQLVKSTDGDLTES